MPAAFSDPRSTVILDIVATETGVARAALVPEATLDALGIPSLDLIHALFAIETHFDVEIPMANGPEGAEFVTMGDLVAHVLRTLGGPAA